jgi:hypothetical protein
MDRGGELKKKVKNRYRKCVRPYNLHILKLRPGMESALKIRGFSKGLPI